MKVKITKLGKKDAHYNDRYELIGLVGKCEVICKMNWGYKGIYFTPDKMPSYFQCLGKTITFAYAKFEEVQS